MNSDDIKLIYAYDSWANRCVLAACERISDEQYAAAAHTGTGYESLRATVLHIIGSEHAGWRLICQE